MKTSLYSCEGYSFTAATRRTSASHGLFLRRLLAERIFDLLLDVAEIPTEFSLLVLGQQPEWHPHHTLGELHVQPVLAVFRATRDVEVKLAHARAIVGDLGLVPWHRARVEVGEKSETV